MRTPAAWHIGRAAPRAALAAGLGLSLVCATSGVVQSRQDRASELQRVLQVSKSRASTAQADRKEPVARPAGPLVAVVSIGDQRVSVYGSDGLVARAPVSTGMRGHGTPQGVFSVIQKNKWHRSNIYSNAPMPFMQRITWSGVALHAGALPGYPASHGCIRLPYAFAQQLWGMTKMGARVIVASRDAAPFDITHPLLPAPMFKPAGTVTAGAEGVVLAANTASGRAMAKAVESAARPLNPQEQAQAAKLQATADASVARQAAKSALAASTVASAKANTSVGALRRAQAAHAAAEAAVERAATKAADAALSPEAAVQAEERHREMEQRLAETIQPLKDARIAEAFDTAEAFALAATAREAVRAADAADDAAQQAERATHPLSVFISRKEKRLFVRQGWMPMYDAPVTIRDADAPLGTHVFTAMGPAEDERLLRWSVVSVPEPEPQASEERAQTKVRVSPRQKQSDPSPAPRVPATAQVALSRIEMSEETQRFLAERTWIGASLIVSDHGVSSETGKYTDFIVLTR